MQTIEAGEMEKSIFLQLAVLQQQMNSATVESGATKRSENSGE
jgi:hypothetical protein